MPTLNVGRVRAVYKDEYSATTAYVVMDRVLYQGSVYECVKDTTAGTAPQENDTTYWVKIGAQGLKGDKGDKGDTGPQGPPGTDGADGAQGVKGDMPAHKWEGTSLSFENPDGSYGTAVNLIGPTGPAGPGGADGAQGVKGDMPAHKWNGTKLSFQNPDGEYGAEVDLVGPQGPQGEQGIQGIQGVKGDTGEQGPQGDPGPQGPAVPLSDSVTSTSHTDAASSYAVKQAYDRGSSALTAANNAASSVTELAGTVDDLESDIAEIQTSVEGMKTRTEWISLSRDADVAANTEFTVCSYKVGSKTLNVYLNGLRCQRGVDFEEVGTTGQTSTKIKFTEVLKKEICVVCTVF